MGKTKLKLSFSPLFIIFAFCVIYFGWLGEFLIYLLVMLLHELAHYVCAKILGYRLNKILFMPYGAQVGGQSNIFLPKHEIIIALAGPVLNLVLVLLTVVVWWFFPITYAYTQEFIRANLVLGAFNLLPAFPLDGGRVLASVFGSKVSRLKVLRAMRVVGVVFTILFAVAFVCSVFWGLNLTFIFIATFLLISSFQSDADIYYERTYVKNFSPDKTKKPLPLKTFVVSQSTSPYELIKHIKGNNFTQFAVLNEHYEIIEVLTEAQILNSIKNKK